MKIDVAITPALLPHLDLLDSIVVAVDVLRATSSMIVAFEKGVSQIYPVETVEEAISLSLKISESLLVGEVSSVKPVEFQYDNSPVALYHAEDLAGKSLVMRTTNGTALLKQLTALGVPQAYIGSFLNLQDLLRVLQAYEKPICICCAGNSGEVSVEDLGFAGAFVREWTQLRQNAELTDAANVALSLWENVEQSVDVLFSRSTHAEKLEALGRTSDLVFIAEKTIPYVPVFFSKEGVITLLQTEQRVGQLL